ncbi:hypothetical protein NLJ89_g683 [Agrocybe chaxingu]|uniref:SET domain-containing protein n=1 Tax=Agrocybe chaxingu TaxID=84603 RepID=A0A9W8N1G9_9AGAR|nr:hypothetical protein NLJ89_g683 [Agrocybe chaxingu]
MTLCPILDFANHQTTIPTVLPEATQAELWNTGPLPKRNFGDNFTLLSPPVSVAAGQELFLKYGSHANSTLFVEYGFVNVANWEASEEETGGEVEVDTHVEELFNQRGEIGSWMKDILTEEGYWGDWTIHATPAPAHPSYRLITTLRFYHLLRASANAVPANSGQHVQEWRNVTLGLQEMVSEENEHHWRMTLRDMCEYLATNAQRGRMKVSEICLDTQKEWLPSSILFIETLWREEMHVARSVIESLNNNADF